MMMKPGLRDFLWMIVGAALLLAVVLTAMYFRGGQNSAEQPAFKAQRLELVGRMRLSLAAASEAEKSAVMAITDEDSQAFADQARAASALVERRRRELEVLLQEGGTAGEEDVFSQFSRCFAELQRIDDDLLNLAVRNTNLKAYSLAFGSAAEAVKEMDAALSRIVAASANATSPEAKQVMLLASAAQVGVMRMQALLPPHIAEEGVQRMDALEALMAKEDREVRKALAGLATVLKPGETSELEKAASSYARFGEIRAQILKLSRENTNVQSLAVSLNQKRRAMVVCQDALTALDQAIRDEPISAPMNPRQMSE